MSGSEEHGFLMKIYDGRYNPFFIPKFFGQNVTTKNMQPGGVKEMILNGIYDGVVIVILILAVITLEDKSGEGLVAF